MTLNYVRKLALISALPGICCSDAVAQTVTSSKLVNPVVSFNDGCVERFAGYYYAYGNPSKGKIYSSKDMVTWDTPVQGVVTSGAKWLDNPKFTEAYTYKTTGAGDLLYRNGVWHTYFNGIGHSYCAAPRGIYTEQCIDEPFDNYGIDAQVFQDEDGTAYYVKKRNQADPHPMTQAPTNISGPEVWVFKMNSLFSRWDITDAKVQLTHQPGHPTSLNHMNFEGPELAQYRGRYYMFYAVNRMGPRSGMYEVGAAECDSPMGFNNACKYPHPVLARNTEQQLLEYVPLAPTAEHGGWAARYCFDTPDGDWTSADYDDSSWLEGEGGFGRQEFDKFDGVKWTNARVRARKTFWTTPKLYLRREFTIDNVPSHVGLKVWINADADLYINGHKMSFTTRSNTYSARVIDPSWLVEGKNVIACEADNTGYDDTTQNMVDFGLYDTGDSDMEDITIGPAQPNFIQGPNGFEHWMMYKVYINGTERQALSRIHFRNREVTVEPTAVKNTKGYHPAPAQPTILNYCDYAIYYPFEFLDGSSWVIRNKILKPEKESGGRLLLRKQPETSYRFEVPFRITDPGSAAEVYAAYVDDDNWVKIRVNRSGTWEYVSCVDGTESTEQADLPQQFAFLDDSPLVASYDEPWHTVTVYKNGDWLKVMLDAFNLTLDGQIRMPFGGVASVGLGAPDDKVEFDALNYTLGWDEYDSHITGWDYRGGDWTVADDGLTQHSTEIDNEAIAVKGDPMWNYDFTAYMTMPSDAASGQAGFYPVYVDDGNYLQAMVNPATATLEVSGRCDGNPIASHSLPLNKKVSRQYSFSPTSAYPTTTYTYDLSSPSVVSGVDLLWCEGPYPYLNQTFDLPQQVYLFAKNDKGGWTMLDVVPDGEMEFSKMNTLRFAPVRTSAIKMLVKNRTGKHSRAFSAYFHEDMATSYLLRCRREVDGGVRIFVDDQLMTTVDMPWPASVPALAVKGMSVNYNGILCYQSGAVRIKNIALDAEPCEIGESVRLEPVITPVESTNTVLCWTSSNPDIMSVDGNGVITRHKEGDVKITCYAADGGAIKASVEYSAATVEGVAAAENIKVYPNPVRDGILHIESDTEVEELELYTIAGSLVQSYPSPESEINVSALPAGTYFVRIRTAAKVCTEKIIIH